MGVNMSNASKKAAMSMMVFALLGSPLGTVFMWLYTLLWTIFNDFSNTLVMLSTAPAVLFMALFSYFSGFFPALLAGLLFSIWYMRQVGAPSPWKMAAVGFMMGGAAIAALMLYGMVVQPSDQAGQGDRFIWLAIGAGALCALVIDLFQTDV
mgnify:CR=1 FL=1